MELSGDEEVGALPSNVVTCGGFHQCGRMFFLLEMRCSLGVQMNIVLNLQYRS